MASFVPHTDAELAGMLDFLGLQRADDLFASVPAALRLVGGLDLPPGRSEPDVADELEWLALRNRPVGRDLICFAGAGAYDHEVPAVTRSLASRSEFVTSYTPYQPEVSQGVLQALFEYQTMVARLAGVEIANASLYDGANALVEGANLAVAATGRPGLWCSAGVHPHWRSVLGTLAAGTGHQVVDLPLAGGLTDWPDEPPEGSGPPGALLVAYPNVLGCIESLPRARAIADRYGAVLVVAADPVAAGLLRSPGELGADVVVGEGQALGMPLSFGGPYLGLFACRAGQVRRLPGRLVGETLDTKGRRSYVTTLRAREQDIRREKASSNVCTNETLMAITVAIQLGWLGTAGLAEVALRCARATRYCREALLAIPGVEPVSDAPVLREFAIRSDVPSWLMVERLAEEGFLAGVALEDDMEVPGAEGALLVAVTEKRTRAEIDAFVAATEKVVR